MSFLSFLSVSPPPAAEPVLTGSWCSGWEDPEATHVNTGSSSGPVTAPALPTPATVTETWADGPVRSRAPAPCCQHHHPDATAPQRAVPAAGPTRAQG